MVLLLDNFDSFTYNLADYIAQCGVTCRIVRNNASVEEVTEDNYEAVILSPGPETPHKAGNLLQVIDYYANRLPILGICLGHQALGVYFGAELTKAVRPMHGKISHVHLQPDYLYEGLPDTIEVVRYHSLILENMPSALQVTGITAEKEVMAFRHTRLPVRGMQFHPEAALTTHGLRMISNWVKFNRIAC